MNEVLNGYKAIISSLLIIIDNIRVGIGRKTNCPWGFNKEQVGGSVPSVVVLKKILTKLVGVPNNILPDFLHVAEHTGTAGTPVEPDGKWS